MKRRNPWFTGTIAAEKLTSDVGLRLRLSFALILRACPLRLRLFVHKPMAYLDVLRRKTS
jgi:hypothetical protein